MSVELEHIPFDYSLLDVDGYNIAFSKDNCLIHRDNGLFAIIVGTAIYDSKVIDNSNFFDVVNEIEFSLKESSRKLSGRFSIIYIKEGVVKVYTSLFGSVSIYYIQNGKYISTVETLLSNIFNLDASIDTLGVMLRYYARYRNALYKGVSRFKYASLSTVGNNVNAVSYLNSVFSCNQYDTLSNKELVASLNKRLCYLLSLYSCFELRVGLTGGRDSRLILAMSESLGIKKLSTYTVGKIDDIESKYASKSAKYYGYHHEIFSPDKLNSHISNNYFALINNINFPSIYKWQLIEYLRVKPKKHLNTATPETLLCHLDYFEGENKPYLNFIKNRASKVNKIIPVNQYCNELAEEGARLIWDDLSSEINSNVLIKLMFEQVSYQSEWVYNILKIGDYSGGTVCIFEDPIVLSILSNIDEDFYLNDCLYKYFVNTFYPSMNNIISTRDCDIGRVMNLPKTSREFISLLPDALKDEPLEYLLSENIDFIRKVIIDNRNELSDLFGCEFINDCIVRTQNGFIHNRIKRFIMRRLNRKVLSNYELIMPYCAASILNFNKRRTNE
ncbi:hypothetical protein [Aliivibrio fischeri]|uniref:hypothetical protein n=1 Tax=Aliivibrio fischeri TaxID=668 RepID=UPI0011126127|nr:hypothetical protein [Aliivibrio fischeri]